MSDERIPLNREQLVRISKYLVFGGVGVALLIMAGTFSKSEVESPNKLSVDPGGQAPSALVGDQITREETILEERIAGILGKMDGAGQVEVRVNLASSSEKEFAVNETVNRRTTQEKDRQGAARTMTENTDEGQLVMEQGVQSSGQGPVLVTAHKPEVSGVLVVAQGAANLRTRLALTRTLETLLDIPANKISVQPMEN